MNILSYGLLGLLAREPRSGYDLTQYIKPFWPAKHSQIYPLLGKMEHDGYLTFDLIRQSDKPDKKIYTITSKGIEELKRWIDEPTSDPVNRDEMMLKAYSIWLTDPEKAIRLFEEREKMHAERAVYYESLLVKLKEDDQGEQRYLSPGVPTFSRYILLTKALTDSKNAVEWCQWVLSMLKKG
ncbi:PadR family transcriptional regulator [Paenibacillus gansuensis]|uniref:PadR family transcriptional regulator n=1 Tax=Paenibacillus gansuensis TaxID=306542 RepID=A0ABW5PH88_9BACL